MAKMWILCYVHFTATTTTKNPPWSWDDGEIGWGRCEKKLWLLRKGSRVLWDLDLVLTVVTLIFKKGSGRGLREMISLIFEMSILKWQSCHANSMYLTVKISFLKNNLLILVALSQSGTSSLLFCPTYSRWGRCWRSGWNGGIREWIFAHWFPFASSCFWSQSRKE